MEWLAVDLDRKEYVYENIPKRMIYHWYCASYSGYCPLPKGTIKKLIGRKLTWNDEPVELKEE